MKLYLLSQQANNNYGTYDSLVVCAGSEEQARKISPSPYVKWDDSLNQWYSIHRTDSNDRYLDDGWVNDLELIVCEYLGKAEPNQESGVICSSYTSYTG